MCDRYMCPLYGSNRGGGTRLAIYTSISQGMNLRAEPVRMPEG